MPYRFGLILVAALAAVPGVREASAHSPGQSYVFLRIYDDAIEARLEITAADLDRALGLGITADGEVGREEVATHLAAIQAYVNPRFSLHGPDGRMALHFQRFDVRYLEIADYVMLTYSTGKLREIPDRIEADYRVMFDVDPAQRNLLVVEHNWKTGTFNNESKVSLVFSPLRARDTLDLSSASILVGFLALVQFGVWHIWIGLDHILFLLALTLPSVLHRENGVWKPAPTFRHAFFNIFTIVTCFTVAHSITLGLATLDIARPPDRLVEAIIALSIAVAALHNLFPRFHVPEWSLALVFGLFHGFGFAGVLSDLGLESQQMVLSLLGFNMGVEVGQVVIVALVFPLLFAIRGRGWYLPYVLRIGSLILITMALLWFVERAFDVTIFRYGRRFVRRAARFALAFAR